MDPLQTRPAFCIPITEIHGVCVHVFVVQVGDSPGAGRVT
jgi:hypothetical protein